MKKLIFTNRKGSALLVALLVMAVLISISLALSTLVLRETRITREFLDAGQAYYSAESGIELALYNLKNQLPGWQPTDAASGNPAVKAYGFGADAGSTRGDVRVKNRCQAYPCFDTEEFDVAGADASALYGVLDLNQSITVPLFVVGDGVEKPVKDFRVQYYTGFTSKADFAIDQKKNDVTDWDVLRWKIFGLDNGFTDSISDFTSVSLDSNAAQPSWFGTFKNCDDVNEGKIGCREPPHPTVAEDGSQNGCEIYEAREYYAHPDPNKKFEVVKCKNIGEFLTGLTTGHKLNYLTLTNQINPGVLNNKDLTKIYFRIELFGDKADLNSGDQTVREYADISANGYAGNSKQSINVKIKRGSFMPVFNFALYSTYITDDNKKHNYYYDEQGNPTFARH